MEYDEDLFEELRALRRRIADEQDVPAFVVFGDVALRHMAARRPETLKAFERVPGVGQAKLAAYGAAFTEAIRRYVDEHGLPASEAAAASTPSLFDAPERSNGARTTTHDSTRAMLARGLTVEEIAKERRMRETTVLGHIEHLAHRGEALEVAHLAPPPDRMRRIEEALKVCGSAFLRPVWEYLGPEYTYDEIRVARVCLRQQGRLPRE